VVGDEGEVVVLALPGHLVDADVEQRGEPVGIELVGALPGDDPPDRVPVDAQQPADRRLVDAGGQPGHQTFEVAREAGAVTSERHALGEHAMAGTAQPPDAQIEVPPDRVHRPRVLARRGRELAARAPEPTAPKRNLDHHPVVFEPDLLDPHSRQTRRRSAVRRHFRGLMGA
jgi:hypothetical protein